MNYADAPKRYFNEYLEDINTFFMYLLSAYNVELPKGKSDSFRGMALGDVPHHKRRSDEGGRSGWLAENIKLDNKLFALKTLPSILVSSKRAYCFHRNMEAKRE